MLRIYLLIVCTAWLVLAKNDQAGKFYHKVYNSTHNGTHHQKAWMVLDQVDGLRNEDVVLLISGSSARNFKYLRERIISSARTWMKLFANAFVIVEDTYQSRFAFRHCHLRETPHFTSFDCHNEPTYVLSRKCLPTKGGGPGPCCKVDELFTYLMVDRPDVYSHTKYVFHGDDDNFFRVDQTLMFIARLEKIGLSTIPIVGNPGEGDNRALVYGTPQCKEIHPHGWYQPLMINRAAMERMRVAFSSYGVKETCENFHVTHDVGLGPFLWMFGVNHLRFPGWVVDNHDVRIGSILTHKVVHDGQLDACDNITAFGPQRYNQKILMGCGDVNEPQHSHRAGAEYQGHKMYNDNYDLWNHFKVHNSDAEWGLHAKMSWDTYNVTLYANGSKELIPGMIAGEENTYRIKHILNMSVDVVEADGTFKGDRVVQQYLPIMEKLFGYDTTNHSKHNDVTKKWVGFKPSDCASV